MTEHEIAERELLAVCVHEFGHWAACRAVGGYGIVNVWPGRGGDEAAWLGNTRPFIPDIADRPIVGLAGVVAEILLLEFPQEGYTFEDAEREAAQFRKQHPMGRLSTRTAMTEWCHAVEQSILEKLEMDEVSITDLEMMGDVWRKRLRRTVSIVTNQSSIIMDEAERLADVRRRTQ